MMEIRNIKRAMMCASVAGMLVLPACNESAQSGSEKAADVPAAQAQERTVTVVRVAQRKIVGDLSASGDLVPQQEAAVMAEVSGYPVAAVLADVGDYVKKGQVLVVLDPALMQSQLAQAEAQMAQALAQAAQAEDQAARVAGLDNEGVLSPELIVQRRYQARSARATANAQIEALRNIQKRAEKLRITAPVDGLILEKAVQLGELSATPAAPWFRIAANGEIELAAQLAERDLSRIRVGQTAEVELPSGEQVSGTVRLINPQIDPGTKLGTVRITLPIRDDVRAGGFARAVFADGADTVSSVPETAVHYDSDGPSVMVVDATRRVQRVGVRTGARGSGLVQFIEGPSDGTMVVLNASSFLLDGEQVQPVEVEQ